MSNVKIEFNIEDLNSDYYENAWDAEGGLLIKKNDTILTKRIDDPNDDGFRGDYVFFNLMDWLTSTLELLEDKKCYCQLINGGGTFFFEPKENFTYFKFYLEGTGHLIEDENKRYPNHEEGTPLKTDELVLEIIRIAELFIDSLSPKIKDKLDVIRFKQSLEEAREVYDQYIMRRELHY